MFLLFVFVGYPMGRSIVLSLHGTASSLGQARWVGLANYRFVIRDRLFWGATANTAAFALGLILLQMPLSLLLAVILNHRKLRFRSVFRAIFFSTYLVGGVVGAVLFALLLDPRHGWVNRLLSMLSQHEVRINWLGNPKLAMISVLLAALWLSVGYGMIYLLAGLQAIDPELYDAARMDGAGAWPRFLHITLPGLWPVLSFLIIVATIGGFQLFELPYVLFRQSTGPNSRGLTVVMYLFLSGFQAGDLGYASAIGWTLVTLIASVVIIQYLLLRFVRWRR